MTRRIFRGIFYMTLITMIICATFIMGMLYEYYDARLRNELKSKAQYVASGIEASGDDYLTSLPEDESRITLISPDGTVQFDSKANEYEMKNHSDREEIVEAQKNGEGEAQRYSDTLSQKTYYYAIRLSNGDVLRLSSDLNTVWSMIVFILYPLAFVIIIAVILSAIISNSIAKKIVKPINSIDLKNPEETECYEEIAPLLREINYQNDKIAKQIKELKQKQREFALISDNMSEGLLIVDKDTDILSINRSMQKFFGAQGDIIGESALRINRSEVFRDVLSEVLNGSHVNKILTMNKRYYEITANPVFTNEVLDGAVILAVDITEKEERDKLRREFSSNVSHELKTPLSSIYGVSDMMMNGMVKPEDVKGFAKDINDEASRLIALVNDIIKLSQLDEGNIPVEKEPVDLFEMAKDVVKRLQPEAQKKQVQLNVKGETAKILGIGQILNEMLYNIVENAIKYNREEGSVDITVEDGSLVKVEVADTGIGIEPQYQERVFERFFRVDKSHSKKIGGTGLGLSIVKHAVKLHDGKIEMKSKKDEGTTITVYLPKGENE